jgi:hypothetical protein
MCIREMELIFIEENVNPCERNEERRCCGPEGSHVHKAVREQAVKACGTEEVHLTSFLTSALNRNP